MKTFLKSIIPIVLAGIFISCSRNEPAPSGPPVVEIVPVKVNEVYTRGILSSPDWIEIYNPNSSSVDISGYKVYNLVGKNGTKPKKVLPAGTTIAGKSLYVVVVNDTVSTSGFDLSAAGETVWFENGSGIIIDSVLVPTLGIDSSYARKPDGAITWATVTPPTKGTANSILPIVMNEIFSRGVPGDLDWIEIYNPNATSIDVGGYKIYDVGGQSGVKPKKEIPSGISIPGKGFYVITVDTADANGTASGFGLSSTGEVVWLENANGNIIDNITFPAMPVTTTSYGRNPDGSTTLQILTTVTKGAANKP